MLWEFSGERAVSSDARDALLSAEGLFVSAVSFAEMGIKAAVGKLEVPEDLVEHLLANGLQFLPLSPEHGLAVARLPSHHRDPFDRLLVTQAQIEGMTILTADREIMRYDVPCIAA